MVDSSFFWGYIVTQIPGGFLAARFPANRVFGSAIATSAFLNMLLPIAAKAGFQYVMLLRILQGLVEVSYRGARPPIPQVGPPIGFVCRPRASRILFAIRSQPISGAHSTKSLPFYYVRLLASGQEVRQSTSGRARVIGHYLHSEPNLNPVFKCV